MKFTELYEQMINEADKIEWWKPSHLDRFLRSGSGYYRAVIEKKEIEKLEKLIKDGYKARPEFEFEKTTIAPNGKKIVMVFNSDKGQEKITVEGYGPYFRVRHSSGTQDALINNLKGVKSLDIAELYT